MLEIRIPSDSAANRYGSERNASNNTLPWIGNAEHETHARQNQAKLEEADAQIGKQFAQQKAKRAYRRDEKLLQCAALFLTHDRKMPSGKW